jgi:hypothetical protein
MNRLSPSLTNALVIIGHFGPVTTRELAQLNWPTMAPASAIVTSQGACRQLLKEGLVVKKSLPLDKLQSVFVLGSKGAKLLNELHMEQWLDHAQQDASTFWFGDGYNLSLKGHVTRRPLIALLHSVIVATADSVVADDGVTQRLVPTLHAIGQRSMARGFLGLAKHSNFDAMLVDSDGSPKFGVYLAHSSTMQAVESVGKLAGEPYAFLIAAHNPTQLAALVKWRETSNTSMANYLRTALPPTLADAV